MEAKMNQAASHPSPAFFRLPSLVLALSMLLAAACAPTVTPTPQTTAAATEVPAAPPGATATVPPATATAPPAAAPTLPPTEEAVEAEPAQDAAAFPLGELGPYHAGNQRVAYVDESRDGREVEVLIWYPALRETDGEGKLVVRGAEPDLSGAPYPLILTEENSGRYLFLSHLASHGFVMAAVQDQPAASDKPWEEPWEESLLMGPVQDFLFALDQIALAPPGGLEGVIDADHAGVVGFSYGGDISLTLSGARVDPAFYLARCEEPPVMEEVLNRWVYVDVICRDAANWDQFLTSMGEAVTVTDDGLWQPVTDERIRAVMPMAPSVSWYFGERGLAAADRPVLILFGTRDDLAPYIMEAGYTLEHLGTPERFLISFVGNTHFMVFDDKPAARMRHFTVAFFGTYLQGKPEYRDYFSEEFVAQFNDLAWGVYSGN
jgi:predicted dienelactone hydrolase